MKTNEATTEPNLEDAWDQMSALFKKREAKILEREASLEKNKIQLKIEHPNLGEPSDVLSLDVGGTKLKVLRSTLTQVEDSLLSSMFSGRWDDNLSKDEDGCFFIDQPIDLFQPMIDHLRGLTLLAPHSGPPPSPVFPKRSDTAMKDTKMEHDFFRMVEHFGVEPAIYPFNLYEAKSETAFAGGCPKFPVKSSSGGLKSYYLLVPCRISNGKAGVPLHSRQIVSFEVKLGEKTTTAQVGWASPGLLSGLVENQSQEGGSGVGYAPNSCALDIARSVFLDPNTGGQNTVSALSVAGGSTIRCEKVGSSWYVDGDLVVTENAPPDQSIATPIELACIPCVTTQGDFSISGIELGH